MTGEPSVLERVRWLLQVYYTTPKQEVIGAAVARALWQADEFTSLSFGLALYYYMKGVIQHDN